MSSDPEQSVAYDGIQLHTSGTQRTGTGSVACANVRCRLHFKRLSRLAESEELRSAAADAVARGVPVGSGGSRLLRGNHAT